MGSGSPLITAVFVTQSGRDRIVKLKVQSMISVVGSKLKGGSWGEGGGARLIRNLEQAKEKRRLWLCQTLQKKLGEGG